MFRKDNGYPQTFLVQNEKESWGNSFSNNSEKQKLQEIIERQNRKLEELERKIGKKPRRHTSEEIYNILFIKSMRNALMTQTKYQFPRFVKKRTLDLTTEQKRHAGIMEEIHDRKMY